MVEVCTAPVLLVNNLLPLLFNYFVIIIGYLLFNLIIAFCFFSHTMLVNLHILMIRLLLVT